MGSLNSIISSQKAFNLRILRDVQIFFSIIINSTGKECVQQQKSPVKPRFYIPALYADPALCIFTS